MDEDYGNGLGDFDWEGLLNTGADRGLDILGAVLTDAPYYSPNDPRFGYETVSRPVANYDPNRTPYSMPQYPQNPTQITARASTQGISGSIPTWALVLIGVVGGAFLLGKGRR